MENSVGDVVRGERANQESLESHAIGDRLIELAAKLGQTLEQLAALRAGVEETKEVIALIREHLYYDSISTNQFLEQFRRFTIATEDRQRDILELLIGGVSIKPPGWHVRTDHPLAADTVDHLFPRGTSRDNTRHPRFVAACETVFGRPLRHLDLGCAGGGLVWDFTLRGHVSVGLEGSNLSQASERAEWRTIPDRLFVADVRFPFSIEDAGNVLQRFDLITAWELFEHIPENHVPGLLANIARHLKPDGLLAASVATFDDTDEQGHQFHATVRNKDWWVEQLGKAQFDLVPSPFDIEDFPRGSGNTRASDWNVATHPHMGFHITARPRS